MNSNPRFHLASLLNKDEPKLTKRQSVREKNETQRVFGKEISNNGSGLLKDAAKRLQSKSINSVNTRQQLVDMRVKELLATKNPPTLKPLESKSSSSSEANPNIQMVPEYYESIVRYMVSKEARELVSDNLFENQKEFTEKHRATLIDWLVDAHFKFKLLPQTLFKTISTMDRFLAGNEVPKSRAQLLAVAALFMTCKYQEIYPPQPKSFISLANRSFGMTELIQMEGTILKYLEFNLTTSTPLYYLEIILADLKLTQKECCMSRYLLELSLLDPKYLKYTNQLLAAGAVYLTSFLLKKPVKMNYEALKVTEADVRVVGKDLCFTLQASPKSAFQMSRKKYSSFGFMQVSKIYINPQSEM